MLSCVLALEDEEKKTTQNEKAYPKGEGIKGWKMGCVGTQISLLYGVFLVIVEFS